MTATADAAAAGVEVLELARFGRALARGKTEAALDRRSLQAWWASSCRGPTKELRGADPGKRRCKKRCRDVEENWRAADSRRSVSKASCRTGGVAAC